jgi:hypothetical protein
MHQGELARSVRQRWAQHHLPLAEAMAAAAWLSDGKAPLEAPIAEGYHGIKQYSAHGSGLEYAYGSPSANVITMAYREGYVQSALLATEAALQRATRRLVQPLESFETQGVFVFNGLGAPRDAPVTVEFPREAPQRYRVVDPETEQELPSHHEGYTLRFVVPGSPCPRVPAAPPRAPRGRPGRVLAHPRREHHRERLLPAHPRPRDRGPSEPRAQGHWARARPPGGRPPLRGAGAVGVRGPRGLVPLAEGAVRITAHDERPVRVRLEVERAGRRGLPRGRTRCGRGGPGGGRGLGGPRKPSPP